MNRNKKSSMINYMKFDYLKNTSYSSRYINKYLTKEMNYAKHSVQDRVINNTGEPLYNKGFCDISRIKKQDSIQDINEQNDCESSEAEEILQALKENKRERKQCIKNKSVPLLSNKDIPVVLNTEEKPETYEIADDDNFIVSNKFTNKEPHNNTIIRIYTYHGITWALMEDNENYYWNIIDKDRVDNHNKINLNEYEDNYNRIKSHLEKSKNEYKVIYHKYNDLLKKYKEINSQCIEQDIELAQLKTCLEEVQSQNEKYRQQFEYNTKAKDDFNKLINNLQQENVILTNKNKILQKQLEELGISNELVLSEKRAKSLGKGKKANQVEAKIKEKSSYIKTFTLSLPNNMTHNSNKKLILKNQ